MKMYQVYVCETCGYESRVQDEVELCEAKHIGLQSLEDKHAYDALQGLVKHCSQVVSVRSNEQTRAAYDKAIRDLIAFEKEHNMTK